MEAIRMASCAREFALNSSCETTGSEWEETMIGIKRPKIRPTAKPMHRAIAGGAEMDFETIFNICEFNFY
jgi:hypothetical protein